MIPEDHLFARIWRKLWTYRLRRWLPRLVWLDNEVDVRVDFTEDVPRKNLPMGGLFSGGLAELETRLYYMGIKFDRGIGNDGRNWNLDWSLSGPVRVKFCGRTRRPERRIREKTPRLRVVAGKAAS